MGEQPTISSCLKRVVALVEPQSSMLTLLSSFSTIYIIWTIHNERISRAQQLQLERKQHIEMYNKNELFSNIRHSIIMILL